MKNKLSRWLGYWLTPVLMAALATLMAACQCGGASPTPTPSLTLSSISVTPRTPENLAVGATLQFTATGSYSDGSTADITARATWTTYDTSVATISTTGLATAVAPGATYISAFMSGVNSQQVTVTVVAQVASGLTPASITISPQSGGTLGIGEALQFVATGTYPDGSTADITAQVKWAVSDGNVAAISSGGLFNATGPGTTVVTASLSGITSQPVTMEVMGP